MSYYAMDNSMYRPPPAATAMWPLAPVPGWGTNPERAGPPRVGVGRCPSCALGAEDNGGVGPIGIVFAGLAIGVVVLIGVMG